MAYIRGEYYVYVSGNKRERQGVLCIHAPKLDGEIPLEIFDQLAVMRVAELHQAGDLATVARDTADNQDGNFGAWALQELLGEDPAATFQAMVEAMSKKP